MSRSKAKTISRFIIFTTVVWFFILIPASAQIPETLQKQTMHNTTVQPEKPEGRPLLNAVNLIILGGLAGIFLIFKRVKPTRLSP
jgi:hypothetical protein